MDKTANRYEYRFWARVYALLALMSFLYATTDANAETFTDFTANCENVTELFKGISIDVLTLPDGTYRAYYMGNGLVTSTSSDGVHWSFPVLAYNTSGSSVFPTNPWVFLTRDGRYRMIYQITDSSGNWLLYRAISPDGITFAYEGVAFSGTYEDFNYGHIGLSVPTGLRLPNGMLRMYFSGGNQCIMSALSSDDGLTWTEESGCRIPSNSADPSSPVSLSSGQYGMMYSADLANGGYPPYIKFATSPDLINFYLTGETIVTATGSLGVSDSEVVSMPDGRLRMYFSVMRGPSLTSTYTCLLPTTFHAANCKATINGNLLLNIPYLSYITSSGNLTLWANLLYEYNPVYPMIIFFKLTNAGIITSPSFSCAASTLFGDLTIYIPDVLLPDGTTHLWVVLAYDSVLSTEANTYFVVANYGVVYN